MFREKNYDLIRLAKMASWRPKKLPDLMPIEGKEFPPFIKLINNHMQRKLDEGILIFPELRKYGNQSIGIYTDFGGEHKESQYNTYSILCCGYNNSYGLMEESKKFRSIHHLGSKEMAFKNFSNGSISRALDDYLRMVDLLVFGVVFTVVVSKKIKSLFGDINKECHYLHTLLYEKSLGYWKPKVAEKMLRVLHIMSYLISLLSTDNQKIFWMTDNDAIAPNQFQFQNTLKIFQSILTLYTKNKFEFVGGALPFKEDGLEYLDFLSVADITAGSIEQYFTNKDENSGNSKVKPEADKVLQWLSHDGIGLKKQIIMIREDAERNGYVVEDVKFTELQTNPKARYIEI